MFWINLSTLPMLGMKILVKHVQMYHVYCLFVWSSFEHLDNNLNCNIFCESIIFVVIII